MVHKKMAQLLAVGLWLGCTPIAKTGELSEQESKLVKDTFGCLVKENKCIVRNSLGGDDGEFIAAAKALYFKGVRLVCDGVCYSANVIAFDRTLYKARTVAKERGVSMDDTVVCITQRAKFMLHETTANDRRTFFANPDLQAWVNANGPLLNKDLPDNVRRSGPSSKEWKAWVEKYGALPRTTKMSDSLPMNFEQAKAFWPRCD